MLAEIEMTEKQQLLRMLFDAPGKELVNFKLCRNGNDVSEDQIAADAIGILTKIDAGTANMRDEFGDRNIPKVDAKSFISAA